MFLQKKKRSSTITPYKPQIFHTGPDSKGKAAVMGSLPRSPFFLKLCASQHTTATANPRPLPSVTRVSALVIPFLLGLGHIGEKTDKEKELAFKRQQDKQ